jgi:uncharacterized SAM-binding protein YcdF (DUF218 family)
MSRGRLVAVLGYSGGRTSDLHAVCAARLARAAEETTPADAVLLSGWARGSRRTSEAELMAGAWCGSASRILLDPDARSTYGNAVAVAASARRLGVSEIVLVTSGWHGRRAAALVRAALRDTGRELKLAATDERGSRSNRLRELACWTVVPLQAVLAARRLGSPR